MSIATTSKSMTISTKRESQSSGRVAFLRASRKLFCPHCFFRGVRLKLTQTYKTMNYSPGFQKGQTVEKHRRGTSVNIEPPFLKK
jgi:hypothetical protein